MSKKVEVIKSNEPFGIETKRFYFPLSLKVDCQHCGEELEQDFQSDYIGYPVFNDTEVITFYCGECTEETQIDITLNLTVDVDTDSLRKSEG